jgi:hypothetical protein
LGLSPRLFSLLSMADIKPSCRYGDARNGQMRSWRQHLREQVIASPIGMGIAPVHFGPPPQSSTSDFHSSFLPSCTSTCHFDASTELQKVRHVTSTRPVKLFRMAFHTDFCRHPRRQFTRETTPVPKRWLRKRLQRSPRAACSRKRRRQWRRRESIAKRRSRRAMTLPSSSTKPGLLRYVKPRSYPGWWFIITSRYLSITDLHF